MAIRKSDIHRSLWDSCDQLRGGMDASLYKDYILTLLFVKYVSDRAEAADALIEVPEGCSFDALRKLRGTKDIGEGIDTAIAGIAAANDLKTIIDRAYFNDTEKFGRGAKMVNTLTALIDIFSREELNFSRNRADGDDILGDAYEYLMRNFATESGKSKGQFYTPAEVSRVVAAVAGVHRATSQKQTVYDPTCGSGSLLLKAADAAPVPLTIYGQEFDITTRGLAMMNMIMHGREDADIAQGDVIGEPRFKASETALQTFDFVVANPPFSAKAWGSGLTAETQFERFDLGMPPEKNGDFAFLLHVLASMKATGSGAVILPHGVLFRGNKEAGLREKVLRRGYIRAIIGLPANLFYGTGIPAAIIVLDKAGARAERPVFMIDASRGFVKDGNKNRLRARDIHRIADVYDRQEDVPGYARLVRYERIAGQGFNLNIPRYVDGSEPEDRQDIAAHLRGGVPERDIDLLAGFWAVMPGVRGALFGPALRPGYAEPRVEPGTVRAAIREHPEFGAFRERVRAILDGWAGANAPLLDGIARGDSPAALIHALGEDMLARFADAPLVDRYDAYQRLMDYWAGGMQDDVFIVADAGWAAARDLRVARHEKTGEGRKEKTRWLEEADLTAGSTRLVADVIPPALVVARFFPDGRAALDAAQAAAEEAGRAVEEAVEEHGGEGGALADAMTEAGKLTAASLGARLKAGAADGADAAVLERAGRLLKAEAAAKRVARAAEEALTKAVLEKYPALTEAEIRALVVDDKWLTDIATALDAEIEARTEHLTARVRMLTERYGETVGEIEETLAALEAKVAGHLAAMGFA